MANNKTDNTIWMIMSREDHNSFWSDDLGWCNYYDADSFTTEEKEKTRLPIDGEWSEFYRCM